MGTELIRNIGIAAHIDAGKTTVAERILVETGIERHMGRVEEGTATLDFLAPERERGITIVSACTHVPWGDYGINLIDTPGHVDFTLEVQRCMRVLDGGVLVLDAASGVQAQTETVWRQMQRQGVAALALINKCDLPGVDPLAAVRSLEQRLGARTLLLQYPQMGPGGLTSLLDLVNRQHLTWDGHKGTSGPVPKDLHDETEVLRSELVDQIVDLDEEFMEQILADERADPEQLHAAIARVTRAGKGLPVVFGSGLRGAGIGWLLDGICAYLPSPGERVHWTSTLGEHSLFPAPDPEAPLSAMLFKFQDHGSDELAFLRIYGGTLHPGDLVLNSRTGEHEQVQTLARIHAEHGEDLDSAGPGQIVGVTGLKASATGDTLCDPTQPLKMQVLPPPAAVIQCILEPRQDADREALGTALARLVHQDASLFAHEGPSPGQWTLEGMGELHLEILVGRLTQASGVKPLVGKPRVTYLETVEGRAAGAGKIERTLTGELNFGAVELAVMPRPRTWAMTRLLEGAGPEEVTLQPETPLPAPGQDACKSPPGTVGPDPVPEIFFSPSCSIPNQMRSAVEAALEGEVQSGPRCGMPLAGLAITVVGGDSRPGADSEAAFAQAAIVALRDALSQLDVLVLEPTMSFEVEVRKEFASAVTADLRGRGACLEGFREEGALRVLWGMVPLHSMLGYATGVRSISKGNATCSLRPRGQRVLSAEDLEVRGLLFG
jgi:elongation factor G